MSWRRNNGTSVPCRGPFSGWWELGQAEPAQGPASLEPAGASERGLRAGAALGASEERGRASQRARPPLPVSCISRSVSGEGSRGWPLTGALAEPVNFQSVRARPNHTSALAFCAGPSLSFKRTLHFPLKLLNLYIQKSPKAEDILLSPCTKPSVTRPSPAPSAGIGQTVYWVSISGAMEGFEGNGPWNWADQQLLRALGSALRLGSGGLH